MKVGISSFESNDFSTTNQAQTRLQGCGRVGNSMKIVAADHPSSSLGGSKGKIKII